MFPSAAGMRVLGSALSGEHRAWIPPLSEALQCCVHGELAHGVVYSQFSPGKAFSLTGVPVSSCVRALSYLHS